MKNLANFNIFKKFQLPMHLNNFMVNLDFSVFTFWKISNRIYKSYKTFIGNCTLKLKKIERDSLSFPIGKIRLFLL